MVRFGIALAMVGSLLAGCASPNERPVRSSVGTTPALVMGPNLRVVTQRERMIDGRGSIPTMCLEPSPDVVVAFGKKLDGALTVKAETGLDGSQTLKLDSTEAASAIAGRDKAVLALRDGLYAACQSYANGTLGHDAYALILSQYGNLLVALVGSGGKPGLQRSSHDTAIAGLMVACVSEYDPTRLAALDAGRNKIDNGVLTREFCQALLNGILHGRLLSHASLVSPPSATALAMAGWRPERREEFGTALPA